ncbi:armadillo-type protein [Suillus variegatus]|nr:armadillo-type protein [Suillus variegatus]
MDAVSPSELSALRSALLNTSGTVPLHDRFRALFTLKSLKNDEAVTIISEGFADQSALLKHELAYCLGQMRLVSALPVLQKVLENLDEDPMVRHEAAEAIGAISSPDFKAVLAKYLTDPNRSVHETCEIALAKIEWDNSEEGASILRQKNRQNRFRMTYTSIEPAPPSSKLLSGQPKPDDLSESTITSLRTTLLGTSVPLFQRYRAMFALRNIGTPAAVLDALAAGFSDDSALFKHEIAFVFGHTPTTRPIFI